MELVARYSGRRRGDAAREAFAQAGAQARRAGVRRARPRHLGPPQARRGRTDGAARPMRVPHAHACQAARGAGAMRRPSVGSAHRVASAVGEVLRRSARRAAARRSASPAAAASAVTTSPSSRPRVDRPRRRLAQAVQREPAAVVAGQAGAADPAAPSGSAPAQHGRHAAAVGVQSRQRRRDRAALGLRAHASRTVVEAGRRTTDSAWRVAERCRSGGARPRGSRQGRSRAAASARDARPNEPCGARRRNIRLYGLVP